MNVYSEVRPWGRFEKFNENTPCTVKLLYINQGSRLSLQYHTKRKEMWRIIKGHDIELTISADIPMGLSVPFPIEGATSSIKPPNPAANHNMVNLVICFLNTTNAMTATQSGIVELSSPVMPEERYCEPHVSRPCPPRNNVNASIAASLHCRLPICSCLCPCL